MKRSIAPILGWVVSAGVSTGTSAQERGLRWLGGMTVVGLYADDSRFSDDRTVSVDLFLELQQDDGRWLFYLEGNTSLDARSVSSFVPESNADAATAIDPDGGGRVQLSEINYRFSLEDEGGLTIGLVDPTAYLDRTRITNDENVQFLGTSFVNNPTIGFPDYTVGVVYDRPRTSALPQINAVLTSASGLADNSRLSYRELFRADDDDDGVFAAISLRWPSQRHLIGTGAWVNTKPHRVLDEALSHKHNYGGYFVYDHSRDPHGLNVRAGVANDSVSPAAKFLALAYQYRWRRHVLGAGVSHTVLSGDLLDPDLDDSTHLEVFGRFTIEDSIHLTASIQRFLHSAFVTRESDPRDALVIAGLRFHYSL